MNVEIGIGIGAEPIGNSPTDKEISVKVSGRGAFNPLVKLNINGNYQPFQNNLSFFVNLIAGNTYDIYYKDDEISEIRIISAKIVTSQEFCYGNNTSDIQTFIVASQPDGSLVLGWPLISPSPDFYEVSIDGGNMWQQIPLQNDNHILTIPAVEVPAIIPNVTVRRIGTNCSWIPALNVRQLPIPEPVCALVWNDPQVTKQNESSPNANDGYIRLNADTSQANGAVLYRITDVNSIEIFPDQLSNEFFNVPPGLYIGEVSDDDCLIQTENIGILVYNNDSLEDAPARTRGYINPNGNFTRFFYTYGMTLEDFQGYYPFAGGIDEIPIAPVDEVIDVEEVENANIRVVDNGDIRITGDGDTRIVTI